MPKLICEKTINGVTAVRNITTPAVGNQGSYVKTIVGAGNPFLLFPIDHGRKRDRRRFHERPICSDDVAANNAAIASISANPADVLTYQVSAE
jgi:hypothetical protein